MTTVYSYKVKNRIVLTELQDQKYVSDLEKSKQRSQNQEKLAVELTQPIKEVLEKSIMGDKTDLFETDTINSILRDIEELKDRLKNQVESKGSLDHAENTMKNIIEMQKATKLMNEVMRRSISDVKDYHKSKMEKIVFPDPFDYLSESKQEELLKIEK